MADVDDSETRMEVDEGVEDAEVEVQEDTADKDEDDDVIGNYVDKQDKMDEEGLTFNKDDDDDDELPDFDSKPKKKSSKSSKENGVDDGTDKKKKKRRKAPDGKKKRVSKTTGEEKENKESSSYESEEDLTPPATPPLLNGHVIRHQEGLLNGGHDLTLTQADLQPQQNLTNGGLTQPRQNLSVTSKEERPTTPYTDDELAGVNLRELRSSYLTAAHEAKQVEHTEEIEKSSISIKKLVGTYSSPPPTTPPPSKTCPDDLTPVSFRSLKSAYETTATTPSGAGSRHSSCSSSFGLGGSPHLDQELNGVSFKHLREEYCRTASQETHSRSSSPCKPPPDTGVSIRQLASTQLSNDCKMCGKQVYQMEKIVAEKASWHKNCFKCKECNKHLTLETYQSHEGNLYCKPHFKELFQPKAVVEDENEARKERSTDKPDYGLEELSSANVKQKFSMFENKGKERDDRSLEPAHVRRSQSLMNKAARFLKGDEGDSEGEYGVDNSYLGEYDDDDEEDEEEEEEEEEEDEYEEVEVEVTDEEAEEEEIKVNGTKENGVDEEENEDEEKEDEEKEDEEKDEEEKDDEDEVKENGIEEEAPKPKKKVTKIIKVKKEKPKKEKKEKRSRRERPGKNTNLKEMFESGKIDNYDSDDERSKRKEQIKIDRAQAARSIKDRFERGDAFGGQDSDDERNYTDERRECEEIFREAETARAARKRFNQIDSKVKGEGRDILRSQSFANAPISNRRLSQDGLEPSEEIDFGRDPNLVKSTDKFDDNIDCARTKKLLDMFKKMEMQNSDDDEQGPPPPRRFTPPPEGEEYDSEEYSDDDYTDEDDEDDYTDDEEDEEEEDENGVRVPKYRDEVLDMKATQEKSPKQSARKAASLRAKFEKWENDVDRRNELNRGSDEEGVEGEEAMPSIDTARNLRKMFENKATAQPVLINKPKHKVNRFVGGGGEKCVRCSKTVYALERLEVVGKVLHKRCFKCAKCKSTLGMGNFSVGGDSYYCTTHYKQMFAEKGTYDVFTPNKGKWTRKIEASNGEAPKSQE